MWPDSIVKPVIVIVGPTAVGKTEIALQLAEHLEGEIVSVDSRLFYRGMDIGTAKPTRAEMERVPHHLIDVADPDDTWSLSTFQNAARLAIEAIHGRRRLPFLAGGTGQYIRAVIEGWEGPAQAPDPVMRVVLERWAGEVGPDGLHRRLAVLDPPSAAAIDARNVRRTIRALEVILSSGKRFSDQRKKTDSLYSTLTIGLTRPRPELYERIDRRIEAMLEGGLVQEVQALLNRGYAADLPTMSAIGYREIVAYLRGRMTLDEAVAQMKRLTRRFVRHQGAWFREEDPSIHWFRVGPGTVAEIEALIESVEGWVRPGVHIDET